jgi:hypothetical protein
VSSPTICSNGAAVRRDLCRRLLPGARLRFARKQLVRLLRGLVIATQVVVLED